MSVLVGICGGSGSGKSTLAQQVRHHLGADRVAILSFDTYYRDQSHLDLEQRAALNYDHPDTLDVELFAEHLDALAAGRPARLPVYDFTTHSRVPERDEVLLPHPIVLVEGILLFTFAEIVDRLALRIYRECPEHIRFSRRLDRDTTERGRTPDSVEQQFASTVAPMHERFVAPSRDRAHLVYEHGVLELDEITRQVVGHIDRLVAPVASPVVRPPEPLPRRR